VLQHEIDCPTLFLVILTRSLAATAEQPGVAENKPFGSGYAGLCFAAVGGALAEMWEMQIAYGTCRR
jgi:hypothetical protein